MDNGGHVDTSNYQGGGEGTHIDTKWLKCQPKPDPICPSNPYPNRLPHVMSVKSVPKW